ncbi:phosphatidate cytidylyltransferase [Parasporobacterium paucivorans]|nr:phosphatidate cytidylyltransferase [Parasporobacterium paucivorans]
MSLNSLKNKSFYTRLVSGIILVLIILGTIIGGGNLLLGFCFVISIIGLHELYNVLGFAKKILGIAGYAAAAAYYLLVKSGNENYIILLLVASMVVMMVIFVFRFSEYHADQIFLAFFGILYVAVMISFIYKLRIQSEGTYLVWLIILGSWGSDTFAYLVGMIFGKHKLAPVLSPKKSVEGAVGGVVASGILGIVYCLIFKEHISVSPVMTGLICAGAAVISQIGDLAASGIKRNYEIKDYGRLIPGHGGILDRFDSIIFAAPVIYYLIMYV